MISLRKFDKATIFALILTGGKRTMRIYVDDAAEKLQYCNLKFSNFYKFLKSN